MKIAKLLFLLPLAILLLTPAHATGPTLAAGQTLVSDQTFSVIRTAGNIMFANITAQVTFTGAMQGGGHATSVAIINTSTGQLVFTEQIAFTGTAMGSQPGAVTILLEGNGALSGSSQAHVVLIHGTDGLAGLHGEGNTTSPPGLLTTYSLMIHFDPS